MKQQKTRELLIITKVAQTWQGDFDQRVNELMDMVSKVDTETHMTQTSEIMDVYHNGAPEEESRKRKIIRKERPFEFLVYRN